MERNIRRQGVKATIRGEPNPEYREISGPTARRLEDSSGHFSVGDDRQGTRIYRFHDSPLDRMYSRLTKRAGRYQEEQLRKEYIALQKYMHHWFSAGLEMPLVSADLNRVFASDPGSMSGMAKTERQAHHRKQYRDGRECIGHRTGIVVDNVVCAGHSLEAAGFSIGWTNKAQAIAAATEMLREAGYRLSKLWGIG